MSVCVSCCSYVYVCIWCKQNQATSTGLGMSPKWLPIPRALVKYSASPCTAPQGLISGSSPIPNLLMILKQGTGVICLLPMGFWTLETQDTDSKAEGRWVGSLLVDCW